MFKWLSKIRPKFKKKYLSSLDPRGWIPVIYESFLGAFQTNVQITAETAFTHPTVYACITQIASDIGKLRLRLTEFSGNIWRETESAAFSPILRKPNGYQTRQKFIEQWIISKLNYGNTYILKARDARQIVTSLYVLDPLSVTPLVSDRGDVFYRLGPDRLSGIEKEIPAAPAYEIIHDRMECLFHPLVGIPPLYAGALATQQGLNIQRGSTYFFGNNSRPGGILTAPGVISQETAERLKASWEANYSGENSGKVAVLGDGLEYKPIAENAKDSQLIDQLKWSDEKICSIFKVPPYKVYVGPMPTYDNAEILDKIYYASCLQRLIEAIESLLDEGLSLPAKYGTEFDLEGLMRMDSKNLIETAVLAVGGGIMAPNEGRRKISLPPVRGGDTPYLQQQNYSLSALDERDRNNPFPQSAGKEPPRPPDAEDTAKALSLLNGKGVFNA